MQAASLLDNFHAIVNSKWNRNLGSCSSLGLDSQQSIGQDSPSKKSMAKPMVNGDMLWWSMHVSRTAFIWFAAVRHTRSIRHSINQPVLLSLVTSLWSPYVIGQTIIFLPCSFYLLLSIFLSFSSPNLSGRRLDVYHISTHGVALVN